MVKDAKVEDLLASIDVIEAKINEHKKLLDHLRRSVALVSLWPDVFAAGDNVTSVMHKLDSIKVLHITNAAGEEREFLLSAIPDNIINYLV